MVEANPNAPPPLRPDKEARVWAMLAHLTGPLSVFFTGGLLPFLGPLIIYHLQKDESPYAAEEARESLNFHLFLLVLFVGIVLAALLFGLLTIGIGFLISAPMAIALIALEWVASFVLGLVGAKEAYDGNGYRYPLNWRFIR